MKQLCNLSPGTMFVVPGLGIQAVLISVNICRARVRRVGGSGEVDMDSEAKSGDLSWYPRLEVEVLSEQALTEGSGVSQAPQRRLNMLEAAKRVLAASDKPLKAKEIVQRMRDEGLWDGDGATPEASLQATIYRDMKPDPGKSVFVKTGPGEYTLKGTQP